MCVDEVRQDIDRVDQVIARLLNERARLVFKIARLKEDAGIAIYQPEREKEVLKNVWDVGSEGLLNPSQLAKIFQVVLEVSREIQERNRSKYDEYASTVPSTRNSVG